jgi:hypothetical protein
VSENIIHECYLYDVMDQWWHKGQQSSRVATSASDDIDNLIYKFITAGLYKNQTHQNQIPLHL